MAEPQSTASAARSGYLFDTARSTLDRQHYLGSKGARSIHTYSDDHGLIVFSGPSSRRLPTSWIELSRWCLLPGSVGSVQWSECLRWLRSRTSATTIVSYHDPSVGHTGALYRACGWLWAPTWHCLPTSGRTTAVGPNPFVPAPPSRKNQ
jgi:hypothetical protein